MRVAMVVPTYWARPTSEGWQDGDLVFDHPTPLDGEDTLVRLLRSISILDDKDFELALVVVPTSPEINDEAVARVESIVSEAGAPVAVRLLTTDHLDRLRSMVGEKPERFDPFLNLRGYAQVRNGCLIAARLLGAEAVVLIDDDEVFEDPRFLAKVREGLARKHEGERVLALAGYYLNPDGDYLLHKPQPTWSIHWPKYSVMNSAFSEFIGKPPRYKRAPFAFGGNLTLHSELYSTLPFDTRVTRGEDLDYLMMAMMSGVATVLDNELAIKHLAPPKSHPEWQQLRQDIIRFSYQRAKIRAAAGAGLKKLTPEDLDPYPGFFLRDDLDWRIAETSRLLAESYRASGDEEAAAEALRNIEICADSADPDAISAFIGLRERWCGFMTMLTEKRFFGLLKEIR